MNASQAVKNTLKWPLRRLAASFGAHRRRAGDPRLWVLMYHRVLPASDPRYSDEEPGMVVTPQTFEMHLRWLREHLQPVQLADWIAARNGGEFLPDRAVAVTFDDGWHDNFEFAWPLLQRFAVPATIFAVSDMIGTESQFWPNRLAQVLRHLPKDWRTHPDLLWLDEFGDIPTPGQCDRERIAAVILRAKSLPDAEIEARLDRAEAAIGISPVNPQPSLLNWDELREMCDGGLVDVGSHTSRHTRLTDALDDAQLRSAICDSRASIRSQLDQNVRAFCYPNGDTTPRADSLVKAEYDCAVTTAHGINDASSDPYRLSRISLHEGNSNTPLKLAARLSGWPGV